MKKIYLFVLLLMSMTLGGAVHGQGNYVGIKGGINFVTQNFSGGGGSTTPDRAIKPHFGIVYNAMVSDVLAIQPELQYSGHGFQPVDGSRIDDIDFNYIALPVMLKYYFNQAVNIHGGPELSFLIGGTEVNGVSVTDESTSTNLALAIGLEVMASPNVGFVGRYLGGIVDIDNTSSEIDQATNNLQLSVLITFN